MVFERFSERGKRMFKKIAKILVLIVVCFMLYGGLIAHVRCNRLEGLANIYFVTNLERVYLAMAEYAEGHSGKMPDSQNWSDLLMANQRFILKSDFINQVSYPLFGVLYNENLSGRQYADLNSNCVVLFEGKGPWNATGNKNTFYNFGSRIKQSHLITLGGDIYVYYSSSGAMMRLKDYVYIDPNNLIWE